MNRTDRLYAIAEELRRAGRGGTTSARLARLFEVSPRTIKRDLAALQQTGAPIWAQAGPGGGYVLDGSASLPPVNFTQAQAVAVAVALAALPPGTPFAVDGAAARGKVWDALGRADREVAAELTRRVWFDADERPDDGRTGPGTAGGARAGETVEPGALRAVEQALAQHRVLALTYRSGTGELTRRVVEPILLAHAERRWYLVAWCRSRTAVRWFRLARIERADLTRERHEPRDVAEVGAPPTGSRPVAEALGR